MSQRSDLLAEATSVQTPNPEPNPTWPNLTQPNPNPGSRHCLARRVTILHQITWFVDGILATENYEKY